MKKNLLLRYSAPVILIFLLVTGAFTVLRGQDAQNQDQQYQPVRNLQNAELEQNLDKLPAGLKARERKLVSVCTNGKFAAGITESNGILTGKDKFGNNYQVLDQKIVTSDGGEFWFRDGLNKPAWAISIACVPNRNAVIAGVDNLTETHDVYLIENAQARLLIPLSSDTFYRIFSDPVFSPDGNQMQLRVEKSTYDEEGEPTSEFTGYRLYDLETGALLEESPEPILGPGVSDRGGSECTIPDAPLFSYPWPAGKKYYVSRAGPETHDRNGKSCVVPNGYSEKTMEHCGLPIGSTQQNPADYVDCGHNRPAVDFSETGMNNAPNIPDHVLAAADGKVSFSGFHTNPDGKPGWGNTVIIVHTDKSSALYGHMESQPFVLFSENVSRGTILGIEGSTGSATGEHIHFELRNTEHFFTGGNITSRYPIFSDCGGCTPQSPYIYGGAGGAGSGLSCVDLFETPPNNTLSQAKIMTPTMLGLSSWDIPGSASFNLCTGSGDQDYFMLMPMACGQMTVTVQAAAGGVLKRYEGLGLNYSVSESDNTPNYSLQVCNGFGGIICPNLQGIVFSFESTTGITMPYTITFSWKPGNNVCTPGFTNGAEDRSGLTVTLSKNTVNPGESCTATVSGNSSNDIRWTSTDGSATFSCPTCVTTTVHAPYSNTIRASAKVSGSACEFHVGQTQLTVVGTSPPTTGGGNGSGPVNISILDPTWTASDDQLTVRCKLYNSGAGTTGEFEVRIVCSQDMDPFNAGDYLTQQQLMTLASGQIVEYSKTFDLGTVLVGFQTPPINLFIFTDANYNVVESNEGDNTAFLGTFTGTLTAGTQLYHPDLTVWDNPNIPENIDYKVDDVLNYHFRIRNQNEAASNPSTVRAYWSRDAIVSPSDMLVFQAWVPSLEPNTSSDVYYISFEVPNAPYTDNGYNYILIVADADNTNNEQADEGDNIAVETVSIWNTEWYSNVSVAAKNLPNQLSSNGDLTDWQVMFRNTGLNMRQNIPVRISALGQIVYEGFLPPMNSGTTQWLSGEFEFYAPHCQSGSGPWLIEIDPYGTLSRERQFDNRDDVTVAQYETSFQYLACHLTNLPDTLRTTDTLTWIAQVGSLMNINWSCTNCTIIDSDDGFVTFTPEGSGELRMHADGITPAPCNWLFHDSVILQVLPAKVIPVEPIDTTTITQDTLVITTDSLVVRTYPGVLEVQTRIGDRLIVTNIFGQVYFDGIATELTTLVPIQSNGIYIVTAMDMTAPEKFYQKHLRTRSRRVLVR